MKVWILFEHKYDCEKFIGIFSTKQKAVDYYNKTHDEYFKVTDIDKFYFAKEIELNCLDKDELVFMIWINKKQEDQITYAELFDNEDRIGKFELVDYASKDLYRGFFRCKNMTEAQKIAKDKRKELGWKIK